MQEFYDVRELCRILKKSKSSVYDYIKYQGLKPSLYLGTSPRWSESLVSEWLAGQPKTSDEALIAIVEISKLRAVVTDEAKMDQAEAQL